MRPQRSHHCLGRHILRDESIADGAGQDERKFAAAHFLVAVHVREQTFGRPTPCGKRLRLEGGGKAKGRKVAAHTFGRC